MIEILPIKTLTDEDNPIFGSLNVSLGKLERAGLGVASGIIVTPPQLKLKTVLEHYDFGHKEVFEQSLTLVRKEINSIPIPQILVQEVRNNQQFLLNGNLIKYTRNLWQVLLETWMEQIKNRLWKDGFYPGITEGLEPQVVIFVKKLEAQGLAYFDPLQDEVIVSIKQGKMLPNQLKKIVELVEAANKKLFIPHEYEWVMDGGVKLVKVLPYTPAFSTPEVQLHFHPRGGREDVTETRSVVKILAEASSGELAAENIDGIYITGEKIFDLNKPRDSFENLVIRIVEAATSGVPILVKLADISEGMGKVRGALRLLHQKSLFDPLIEAVSFARHKKGLQNVHIVIPFVRGVNEFLQIKRELATKKLVRKNSLQIWMEVALPENLINLEDYLTAGLDGIVLNLDELVSFLNGFDKGENELVFYKNEVGGLIKFLEDGLKLLHKAKVPFISFGSLSLYPQVLEFLVEKGVWGVVVERYEIHSIKDLLHQTEKRIILRRS